MAGRSYKTEAVVLRSIRFGEADRVLHLYTSERGRIGAVAKGVRKTKSRFGGRLEPLSHAELMLHAGSGELQTVTGVQLIRSHQAALVGYSPRAGGAVCRACANQVEAIALSADGILGIEALLASPLADAVSLGLSERATRDALRVVTTSYEYNGGFRLRTLSV